MSEVKQVRATQEVVTALTQYLIESGAENYIEDHYTITLDVGEPTTAVITVQYTDKPSPSELRVQAEQERDTIRTANQRLDLEIGRLQLIVAEQSVRRFVGDGDQRKMDELVAAGIRADQQEIKRLEGEVANYRELLTAWRRMFDGGIASGELGVLRGQTDAALSTANGEVTE